MKKNGNHVWRYALAVYESSSAHCVHEASANPVSASSPSFIQLTKKAGNQSARLQITAVTKIAEYFERLLRRYGKAITYT